MIPFKFALGQQVKIICSHETGEVLARAEYSNSENSYYLRYCSADGRATQEWWPESALEAVSA